LRQLNPIGCDYGRVVSELGREWAI
jgi:hypothetical protein